ncbi:MAG TPA: acyl-CoA/acyl-ACP dehydrogenase [Candidatus Stackebrandtia faecavium]|nr:acyl-CoA/acyl-ACP dehydrogenase [Candidatus Stackebrandtia faecavium]
MADNCFLSWADDLERIIKDTIAPNANVVDREGRFPRESIDALANAGFLTLTIARAEGGMGASAAEFGTVVRRIAEVCASTAMVFVMHVTALNSIIALRPSAQRERFIRQVVHDRMLVTEAISEPGSGSQWWSVTSTAEETDEGYRIRAEKSFSTSAGHADLYIVSTQTPGSESDRDHAIFAVRADQGEIATGTWRGLGLAGNSSAWITFDSHVEKEALLYSGGDGEGLRHYNEVNQPIYHLGVSAAYLGIAAAALGACIERVRSRQYQGDLSGYGTNLKDYPIARRHIGEMSIQLEAAQSTVRNFAARIDAGEGLDDMAIQMTAVKVYCAEMAVKVAQQSMMACGGSAYAKDVLPVERHLRDAYAGSLMGPNDDFCKELIGKIAIEGTSYHDL